VDAAKHFHHNTPVSSGKSSGQNPPAEISRIPDATLFQSSLSTNGHNRLSLHRFGATLSTAGFW
jgi:hypothetical protein